MWFESLSRFFQKAFAFIRKEKDLFLLLLKTHVLRIFHSFLGILMTGCFYEMALLQVRRHEKRLAAARAF